jgi:prophage regulatory protein
MDDQKNKICRTIEVEALVGANRGTIWRWVKTGQFPRPLQLGPRAVGWRHSDILEWIASRPETAASSQS